MIAIQTLVVKLRGRNPILRSNRRLDRESIPFRPIDRSCSTKFVTPRATKSSPAFYLRNVRCPTGRERPKRERLRLEAAMEEDRLSLGAWTVAARELVPQYFSPKLIITGRVGIM